MSTRLKAATQIRDASDRLAWALNDLRHQENEVNLFLLLDDESNAAVNTNFTVAAARRVDGAASMLDRVRRKHASVLTPQEMRALSGDTQSKADTLAAIAAES